MTVYKVYEAEPLNPISVEKALGLNRGDIESVTKHIEGYVTVGFFGTTLSATLDQKVDAELRKRGVVTGKKP